MRKNWNLFFNKWIISTAFCLIATFAIGQRTVSGILTDNDASPLIGATVLVPGTTTGTITDIDGSFSLNVPDDATQLQVSYTGFESMMLDITNQSTFNGVSMMEATELLDEVVVIGYGRQKKSVVTGAVGSVEVEQLATRGAGQIQSNIQGKVAGIAITPTSGAPDAGFKVKIRGTGSNGPTEPLYIVDGMRTRDIRFLEGSNIASLEILKDAASASIYGAEGANGVVLISTKSGSESSGISYNGSYGVQSYRGNMELMSSSQLSSYLTEAGVSDDITSNIDTGTSTDWIDELFVNAPTQRHTIGYSGGTEKTSIFVGAGYFDAGGIVGGPDVSNFRRLSTNLGINSEVNNRLNLNLSLSYANEQGVGNGFGDTNAGGLIASALLMDPSTPLSYGASVPEHVQGLLDSGLPLSTDEDGNILGISNGVTDGEIINPYIYLNNINGDGSNTHRLFGSLAATIGLVDGLDFTSRVGTDLGFGSFHNWTPSYYANPTRNASVASSTFNNFNNVGIQWENFLTYGIEVNENIDLDLLAGTSVWSNSAFGLNANASGLISEIQNVSYIDGSETASQVEGYKSDQRLQSYFGRASVSIADKYLLMASLRRDGTSMVQEANRFKTYPGVSAGWIISREGFFGDGGIINFLKLRASWGQAGSLSSIFPGAGLSALQFNLSYAGGATANPGSLPNSLLTWETSEQTNFGLDFGFFNDRLTLSADWFNKVTKDLISSGSNPNFIGSGAPLVNIGDMQNTGLEFELGYRNSDNALKYQVSANLTTLKNEVLELANGSVLQGDGTVGVDWNASAFQEGFPAWYFRGYETDGLNADGTANIVDVSGDGEITPDDFTYIGDPHPGVIYGGTVRLEYGGLDFTIFGQGQAGSEILMGFNRTDRLGNKPTVFLDDDFFAPATDGLAYSSDFMVFDGSFFRIKQIQLGYDFGDFISSVENIRAYVSLEDYFTFTSYPGLDPEIGSSFNSALGIDRGIYPIPGRIMVGASLNF